jgi:hypothetical protein
MSALREQRFLKPLENLVLTALTFRPLQFDRRAFLRENSDNMATLPLAIVSCNGEVKFCVKQETSFKFIDLTQSVVETLLF